MSLKEIIKKELNPKYDLEKIDKAKENDEFLKRCGYSILAPVKSIIRGTAVGAIVGSAYGILTEGDPSRYVGHGVAIFGTADLAQFGLRYFGNELIEDFKEMREKYRKNKK